MITSAIKSTPKTSKIIVLSLLVKDIFNDDLQTQLLDLLKIGDQKSANALIQDAIASAGELAPIIEGIIKSLGIASDTASRAVSEKGIASASQDSVAELNGRATAIQGHTFSINEKIGTIVTLNEELLRVVSDSRGLLSVPAMSGGALAIPEIATIEGHTNAIMEGQKMLISNSTQILQHLAGIEHNTGRLEAIETSIGSVRADIGSVKSDIHSVRRNVDDIAVKGIKLK